MVPWYWENKPTAFLEYGPHVGLQWRRFIAGILLFIAGILLFTTQGACCQKSIKPRQHFKLYDMTFGMVFRANTLGIGTIYGGEQD